MARATEAEKCPEPIRAWLPQSKKGHATSYVVNQLSIGLFSASAGPDIRLLTCQILSNLFGSTSVINKGFITLLTYLHVGNKISTSWTETSRDSDEVAQSMVTLVTYKIYVVLSELA